MSDKNEYSEAITRAAAFLDNVTEVTIIPPKPQDVPPQDIPADQPYVPTPAELKSFRDRTALPFAECRRLLTLARGDQHKAIMISRDERMKRHYDRPGATDIFFG